MKPVLVHVAKLLRAVFRWMATPITFLIMPSSSTTIHRLQMSLGVWLSMGALVVGLLGGAFYVLTHHINYFRLLLDNQRLRRQISSYENEIHKVRHSQAQLASLDASLRQLLGMKNKTNIVKASAIGGPKATAPIVEQSPEEQSVEREVEETTEAANERLVSFEEIEKHIGDLKSVYMATPLGKPIRGGWITSYFGQRDAVGFSSREDEKDWHAGVDIASGYGVPIYATADGIVTFAAYTGGYGLLVKISHGFSYSTFYGHNSKLVVKPGERVKRGQLISYMGSTGHSTGPHVHYEVRQHDVPVNPMRFIKEEW